MGGKMGPIFRSTLIYILKVPSVAKYGWRTKSPKYGKICIQGLLSLPHFKVMSLRKKGYFWLDFNFENCWYSSGKQSGLELVTQEYGTGAQTSKRQGDDCPPKLSSVLAQTFKKKAWLSSLTI